MSMSVSSTVAFSWEEEPGVSKQSPKAPKPGPALQGAHKMPESPRKAPVHRLYVPPPPGPFMPARRSVRPEEDPFLAAYLACTKSSGKKAGNVREPKGQSRFGWPGLGLWLGISCKSSSGVVEDSIVRMAKIPEIDPRDA